MHFDNTPVPMENVLGEVGGGFKVIMFFTLSFSLLLGFVLFTRMNKNFDHYHLQMSDSACFFFILPLCIYCRYALSLLYLQNKIDTIFFISLGNTHESEWCKQHVIYQLADRYAVHIHLFVLYILTDCHEDLEQWQIQHGEQWGWNSEESYK